MTGGSRSRSASDRPVPMSRSWTRRSAMTCATDVRDFCHHHHSRSQPRPGAYELGH